MNNFNKAFLGFVVGATVGSMVTYALHDRRSEEVVEDFKDLAQKVRDNIAEQLNSLQGRKLPEEQDDMMGV